MLSDIFEKAGKTKKFQRLKAALVHLLRDRQHRASLHAQGPETQLPIAQGRVDEMNIIHDGVQGVDLFRRGESASQEPSIRRARVSRHMSNSLVRPTLFPYAKQILVLERLHDGFDIQFDGGINVFRLGSSQRAAPNDLVFGQIIERRF